MSLIERVLKAVNQGNQRAGDIAGVLNLPKSSPSIRGALRRLASRGDIERISRGKYAGRQVDILADGLPLSKSQSDALSTPFSDDGWYLSGLQYNRDIGIKIYGIEDIDEAEEILREYAERNISNFNPDFYGIGPIPYDGISEINTVVEVNL